MAKEKKHSALGEWQQRSREEDVSCSRCGRMGITVDHIIPHSFLLAVGLKDEGYEDAENFQYLCRGCNILKANAFDFGNIKTLPLLRKYMSRLEELYGMGNV